MVSVDEKFIELGLSITLSLIDSIYPRIVLLILNSMSVTSTLLLSTLSRTYLQNLLLVAKVEINKRIIASIVFIFQTLKTNYLLCSAICDVPATLSKYNRLKKTKNHSIKIPPSIK